jgi:hypothetical protein
MFELPENLAELNPAELQAQIDGGLDALRALEITPESTEETIAEGERIVGLINTAREVQRGHEADADRAARAEALIQATTPTEPEPVTPPDPEPAPEVPEPTPPEGEPVTPDEVIQPEPVSASGRQSPARRAAANSQPPAVPRQRSQVAALTAAADVPGIPTGAPLDGLAAASQALLNRMRGLPNQRIGGDSGVRHRYGAAMIRKDVPADLVQGNDEITDYDLVWHAGDERRLPGNSLVAAGGWCSPSETLYDLCQYETVQGILDIPEISLPRGGIRWTEGPDFGDIYADCGFQFPESAVIAGTATKTCCMVECPPFTEIRADLIGLCVKAPLLTNATYPELVRRFMEGALVAQQHKVNAFIVNTIELAAGTATAAVDATAISISLQAISYVATGMRYRYRMAETHSIEVIAPWWLKTMIKEDLGMRQFPPDVSDAAVNKWFTDRNMSVQWVFDFQDPTVTGCTVVFPDPVKVLMYPAGTWVKGSIDVINVDAIYDSTNLEQNIYTALFIEEGILAVQRCTHTCAVEIPVCVSGRTAINGIDMCVWPPTTP